MSWRDVIGLNFLKANDPKDIYILLDSTLKRDSKVVLERIPISDKKLNCFRNRMFKILRKKATVLPNQILRKSKKVEEMLFQYDSFSILSCISYLNLVFDPINDKHSQGTVRPSIPEYAALLCLKRPYSKGTKEIIKPKDLYAIQNLLTEIIDDSFQLALAKTVLERKENKDDSSLLKLIVRSSELEVRGKAYPRHIYHIIERLFFPFDKYVVQLLGLRVGDSIKLARATNDLVTQEINSALDRARTYLHTLETSILTRKEGDTTIGETKVPYKAIKKLRKMDEGRRKVFLASRLYMWLINNLNDVMCFTDENLSSYSGVPLEAVSTFLNNFSLNFGDIYDFYIPYPNHELSYKPYIKYDTKYFCPSPFLADLAIQRTVEAGLKGNESVWNKYHKHRHNVIIETAIELLNTIMPEAHIEKNLKYSFQSRERKDNYELDILCQYDSVLFIIEAKGATLTDAARRGAQERVKTNLKELITKPHEQATRALEYINTVKPPVFRREDGSIFIQDKANIRSIFLICLTLEPLGNISASLSQENDFSLFHGDVFPWIVSLYDLMVIAEISHFPPFYPYYVRRRVGIERKSIMQGGDELDILCYYLKEVPSIGDEKELEGRAEIQLGVQTDELNRYMLQKEGLIINGVLKPTQSTPEEFDKLLHAIMDTNFSGRISAIMSLLDLGKNERERFNKNIVLSKRKHQSDRQAHDFTFISTANENSGITYFCGNEHSIEKKLLKYCQTKKNEYGSREWVGIGDRGTKKYSICKLIII